MEKIRIHHLLCLPLFAGEGYSDSFCVNMGRVKRSLEADPGRRLETVCGPDLVCAHCPNLVCAYCPNPQFIDNAEENNTQEQKPGLYRPEEEQNPGQEKPGQEQKPDWVCREDHNHVVEKDRELAEWLGLRAGEVYSWQELLRVAAKRLTETQFTASCSRCRWYRQGLCSYRAWREAVEPFLFFG